MHHMTAHTAGLEPIVDSLRVKATLGDTVDKRGKIARMIESGALIQLRRGLYATRRDLDPHALAGSIYGPSYVSYETALAYHGLIPEAVYEITSATVKRPKEFVNAFGRFRYRRVPPQIYPIGVERVTETEIPFLVASPTKALCDRIALEARMRSMRDVDRWFGLMRLELDTALDMDVLAECAKLYRRPAVRLLWRSAARRGGLAP